MEVKDFKKQCKKAKDLVGVYRMSAFFAAYVVTCTLEDCSKVLAYLEENS